MKLTLLFLALACLAVGMSQGLSARFSVYEEAQCQNRTDGFTLEKGKCGPILSREAAGNAILIDASKDTVLLEYFLPQDTKCAGAKVQVNLTQCDSIQPDTYVTWIAMLDPPAPISSSNWCHQSLFVLGVSVMIWIL